MDFRRASEADFEAEHAILDLAQGGVHARAGLEWVPPALDLFVAVHRHILASRRSFVAEERGRVVAFSAAWVRGDHWFLADLFVEPRFQGRGVGSRLLELALGQGPRHRITIADAVQPISNAMYAREGIVPQTPVFELEGAPRIAAGGELASVAPNADALAALDHAAYGFDRARDHRRWRSVASPTLWLREDEPAAYSYVSEDGWIGPVAARRPADAAAALAAELARLEHAVVHVPGSSRELLETALAAGLRIARPPGLLLLSRELEPPRALAISGYWLL